MKQSLSVCSLVLFGMLIVACNGSQIGPNHGLEEEGFKAFPSPRSHDNTGSIFRVDPDGAIFKVTKLNVTPKKGDEVLPKVEVKAELTLEQIIKTAGLNPVGISGELKNTFKKKQEYFTEVVEGQREYIDDAQVDAVLKDTLENVVRRTDNDYYLIRATILSNKLNYKSGNSLFVENKIKAEFRSLVQGENTVKWDDSEGFSLNKTFPKSLNILYKPELITFEKKDGPSGRGKIEEVKRSGNFKNNFSFSGEVPEELNP